MYTSGQACPLHPPLTRRHEQLNKLLAGNNLKRVGWDGYCNKYISFHYLIQFLLPLPAISSYSKTYHTNMCFWYVRDATIYCKGARTVPHTYTVRLCTCVCVCVCVCVCHIVTITLLACRITRVHTHKQNICVYGASHRYVGVESRCPTTRWPQCRN